MSCYDLQKELGYFSRYIKTIVKSTQIMFENIPLLFNN